MDQPDVGCLTAAPHQTRMLIRTERPYQIGTNCIIDSNDSTITLDDRGWYDYSTPIGTPTGREFS
jgi:hypothetical protein